MNLNSQLIEADTQQHHIHSSCVLMVQIFKKILIREREFHLFKKSYGQKRFEDINPPNPLQHIFVHVYPALNKIQQNDKFSQFNISSYNGLKDFL